MSLCERLPDYTARCLEAKERVAFEVHLTRCARCQKAVQEARRVDGLLRHALRRRSASLPAPSPTIARRLEHLARERLDAPRRRTGRWVLSLASVAGAAALAVVLWRVPLRQGAVPGSPGA